MHRRAGFTLIELLVVIAIVAILSVVVILVLNPAQLLQQTRDSNRLADMGTLTTAAGLFQADQSNGSLGSTSVIYVDIPDPTATSSIGDQCQGLGLITPPTGYAYHCAATSTYKTTNGTGWIPINFSSMSAGSPLGSLPVDVLNTSSTRNYYTYATNGSQYEFTTPLESQKYKLAGTNDEISNDGGVFLATVYEKGDAFGIEPLDYGDTALTGYWPLNQTTGTPVDDSGGGVTSTLVGSPSWVTGKPHFGNALQFNGSNYASTTLGWTSAGTIYLWVYPTAYNSWESPAGWKYAPSSGGYILIDEGGGGGTGSWRAVFNPSAGTEVDATTGQSIAQNQWSNVVMTWSGTPGSTYSVSLYINGVLQQTQTTGAITPSANIGPFAFGSAGQAANNYYTGTVDDVRVYSRALSAAEITAMYNGGR
jgi:prepilin-type N-terminal cleavage/methylation domain-containing protein